ncbi:MAG: hypothetical protein LRY36_02065 [Alphaproteobacteria bacterium]|nr:hypothetical protein [Alphaproteobacteria bacterium]
MGKFDDILYRDDRLFRFYQSATSYLSSLGLTAMGTAIARDYAPTGRLDFLIGGSAMALLGIGIADITHGKNYLSRLFNKVISPFKKRELISQGDILTSAAVGSCIALGGGEFISYLSSHQNFSLTEFVESASFPKIAANLLPFMALSLVDIPSVTKKLNQVISGDHITVAKLGCNLVGCSLIYHFATKAGLPSYQALASLQVSTVLGGALFYLQQNNLKYFMPTYGMPEDERKALDARLAKDGAQEEFTEEYCKMLVERGLLTEIDVQKMKRRVNQQVALHMPRQAASSPDLSQ